MEEYFCPHCHQTTFTADRATAFSCPYCSTEKMLVLNKKIFSSIDEFSNTKIILDRRSTTRSMDSERRSQNAIPVAWLVIKPNPPEGTR